MKRIIYTLTAIFSAIAAAIFIINAIGYIKDISEIIPEISPEEEYSYSFYFPIFAANLALKIFTAAVILALGIFSVIQLKKHTPRIMLLLCGYVFYQSVLTISGQYLSGLLLMAAALTPAIYELSRYGMAMRQEPKRSENIRWPLIAAFTLALGLTAYRVIITIIHTTFINYYQIFNSTDIIVISLLICLAVFCGLMNRRTSVLFRMFFAGCVLFDIFNMVFAQYGFFPFPFYDSDTKMIFIGLAALHSFLVLLIILHSYLTKRGSLISQIEQEPPGITGKPLNDAI